MKRAIAFFAYAILACSLLLSGCVPGKAYRSSIPEQVPPQPGVSPVTGKLIDPTLGYLSTASQLPPGPPCKAQNAAEFKGPCISYIEFDDKGELWRRDKAGRPLQLDAARQLIKAAMKPGLTPGPADELTPQPIVMVFVHGWKHNASDGPPEDTNVQGVKDFLNMLRWHYPDQHVTDEGTVCQPDSGDPSCKLLRHPVIGVYIAWRGDSISHFFPVARTFTYFGREATGYRVGNTSLTDVLTQISSVAHPKGSDTDRFQPMLLMVGHSFGGLVLERTLAQAYMERLNEADSNDNASFADLVVYVNTAVAATDSKQVIDLLAQHSATGPELELGGAAKVNGSKRYPLFVSVSSSDDQATLSALTVGHGVPALGMKLTGSSRNHVPLVCFEPEKPAQANRVIKNFSQTDFFLRTAPHFAAMQSHELIPLDASECAQSDPLSGKDKNGKPILTTPLSVEDLKEVKFDVFGPTPMMGDACYLIVPKNIEDPTAPRCNGTPYFVMEVPRQIIPDHGTIFTQRLFKLLTVFLPTASGQAETPSEPQKGIIRKRGFAVK